MALPSSGQLSIGDISTELSLAKSNVSLGYVSDVVGFTEPDAISDFYGYSVTAGSPDFAIVNDGGYGSGSEACEQAARDDDTTLYFNIGSGSGQSCPSTGNIAFTNSSGTAVFNGGGNWFKSNQCNTAYLIQSDGYIEGVSACG